MKSINHKRNNGFAIPQVLVIGAITVSVVTALAGWLVITLKQADNATNKETAFQIAETGIEYYRWHLAHDPGDFKDGTNSVGPYVHDFFDSNGIKRGEFSLDIVPPATGSTRVIITSTGTLIGTTTTEKKIRVELAKPSFARYAILSDEDIRIGEGTVLAGPVHANGGMRFDGLAQNLVTSARDVYDDPDHSGANEFGVHTHVSPKDPLPPNDVPSRPDIFQAGREFPVPAVDFAGVVGDLATMKSHAQSNGLYFNASGKQGWRVVLKTNDTFDLYKITAKKTPPNGCKNDAGEGHWDTWEIKTQTLQGNYNFPANGIIFFEDNVWVEGALSSARITIAAARFPDAPGQRKSINILNDISYSAHDGTSVLGLIAQEGINVGLSSDTNLVVDAAMVAANGRIGRNHYNSSCGSGSTRQSIAIYGSIASKERYGFAWSDGTGYQDRTITYDPQLLYNPPPEFPLSAEGYEVLSWENIED